MPAWSTSDLTGFCHTPGQALQICIATHGWRGPGGYPSGASGKLRMSR
jgi:hypothetical protein